MKNRLYLFLTVVALICVVGWTTQAKLQKGGQNWEYLEVQLSANSGATPTLNRYGNQGWELVGVTSGCPSSPSSAQVCGYWAYFKRPR